jgi:maltose O-acetyltransferase
MADFSGQKARMLAGELYQASDPELLAARLHARTVLARFNATPPHAEAKRQQLLVTLFARLGEGTVIEPPLRCDYGFNVAIGARSFINFDCVLLDCNRISIGEEVLFGPGVHVYTATHPLEASLRRSGAELALPVTIGDGVWLGGGVIVCPGVRIGENTVVGAGSVVTRDLPDRVLAAGNPCRVLRPL